MAHGFFNAVLRDYARLGRLLAHDGAWDGKQIVSAQWMIDATTVRSGDAYLGLLMLMPGFTVSDSEKLWFASDPQFEWEQHRIMDGLRKAGLPEE